MSDKKPYEVGYKRPPKETQFKKGQSGNPAGRPKGTLNVHTLLQKALAEPVTVTEKGRTRTRTKAQVMVTQVVNKATGGNPRAFDQVVGLLLRDTPGGDPSQTADQLEEEDLAILVGLSRRLQEISQAAPQPPHAQGAGHDE